MRITDLTQKSVPSGTDLLVVVDTTDKTFGPSGTNKKISYADIKNDLQAAAAGGLTRFAVNAGLVDSSGAANFLQASGNILKLKSGTTLSGSVLTKTLSADKTLDISTLSSGTYNIWYDIANDKLVPLSNNIYFSLAEPSSAGEGDIWQKPVEPLTRLKRNSTNSAWEPCEYIFVGQVKWTHA